MSTLTKAELLAAQAAQWPDNDTGLITPEKLRQQVANLVSSAVVQVPTIQDLRDMPLTGLSSNSPVQVLGYHTPGDGGGGPPRYLVTGAAPGTYTDNGGSIIVPTGGDGSAAWLWEYAGPIDGRWCGLNGDGTAEGATFNNALAIAQASLGRTLRLQDGTYNLATVQMVVPNGVHLVGSGNSSTITYSGSSSAIKATSTTFTNFKDFSLLTSHVDANGFELGVGSRNCSIENVNISGDTSLSNTGAAIFLNSGLGFSAGLVVKNCYVVGYKFGAKFVGVEQAVHNWTCITFIDTWLIGRSVGVISGGAGVYFDAETDGVGTIFLGGTIESYDVGVHHINGGHGGSFYCDFEGNATDYVVGATFNGEIKPSFADRSYSQYTNGGSYPWRKVKNQDGETIEESRNGKKILVYEGSSGLKEIQYYRGDSIIDGGAPTEKFAFTLGDGAGGDNPKNHHIRLNGRKVAWNNSAPVDGAWGEGDIVFNYSHQTGTVLDGRAGWQCVAAGTPGTWVPFYLSYDGSFSWTPGDILAGGTTSTTVAVVGWGLGLGCFAKSAAPYDVGGLVVSEQFVSSETIRVTLYNPTGSTITLGSGTWKVRAQL